MGGDYCKALSKASMAAPWAVLYVMKPEICRELVIKIRKSPRECPTCEEGVVLIQILRVLVLVERRAILEGVVVLEVTFLGLGCIVNCG